MSKLNRYGVNVSIESADGYQQFEVYAKDEAEAIEKFNNGQGSGVILQSEVEVTGLNVNAIDPSDVEYLGEPEPEPEKKLNHLDRMVIEHRELEQIMIKLKDFIESNPIFLGLSIEEKQGMREQLRVMLMYCEILQRRIMRASPMLISPSETSD